MYFITSVLNNATLQPAGQNFQLIARCNKRPASTWTGIYYINSTFFVCKSSRSATTPTIHNLSARSSISSLQSTSSGNSQLLLDLPGVKWRKLFCKLTAHLSPALPTFVINTLALYVTFIPYLSILSTYFCYLFYMLLFYTFTLPFYCH